MIYFSRIKGLLLVKQAIPIVHIKGKVCIRYSLFCIRSIGACFVKRVAKIKVDKVINNNIVRSRDSADRELMVMGKGLGFKKIPGDPIDEKMIEKIYVLQDGEQSRHMEELLAAMPLRYIQAANEIVDYAVVSLGKALSNYLYLNVCDHIYYAARRMEEGVPVRNALLTEIRRFYSHEYQIGMESLQIVHKRLGITLPEDEAGFIAMHIVNAEMEFNDMGNTQEMMKIIRNILNIVRYHFHVELDEASIHYDRFITHLKFFVKRVFSGQELDENDESFFLMIRNQYREEYACVLKIYDYIQKEYGIVLTNDEIMYLIIHIRRVIMK